MSSTLFNLLLVALGGGIGGIGRFWVTGAIGRRYGETFAWGTLFVNVSGAASIGVLAGLLPAQDAPAAGEVPLGEISLGMGLVIGLLGSYTTVSSFSLQTLALMRAGEPLRAALNVVATITLCLSAAAAGYAATVAVTACGGT